MAEDIRLNALRRQYIKSLYGSLLGLDENEMLVGPKAYRVAGEGLSSVGSTFPSTSTVTTLSNYGFSIIGTTGSSGTSAASTASQQLAAPDPGVEKIITNMSTASVMVSLATAGCYFVGTTGSTDVGGVVTSTWQYATFNGFATLRLLGMSTSMYLVTSAPDIATIQLSSAASTSMSITPKVVLT